MTGLASERWRGPCIYLLRLKQWPEPSGKTSERNFGKEGWGRLLSHHRSDDRWWSVFPNPTQTAFAMTLACLLPARAAPLLWGADVQGTCPPRGWLCAWGQVKGGNPWPSICLSIPKCPILASMAWGRWIRNVDSKHLVGGRHGQGYGQPGSPNPSQPLHWPLYIRLQVFSFFYFGFNSIKQLNLNGRVL